MIPMPVTRDRVEQRLATHGYRAVRDTGDHALYERQGDRIVVPLHSQELSPWSARAIEWSLEARLGRGWLTEPADASPAARTSARRHALASVRLNLVIRPEPDRSAWNAFVVEEPRILTFGASIAAVRRRATDAAEAWFADAAAVDLLSHLELDAESERWIADANRPTPSPARATEARRQLRLLGYADADIDDLLEEHPARSSGAVSEPG